jgi:predicted GIY-YIG superfamily endonuclease
MYRRHNYAADIAGPTWLYRLYSAERLVYVGVSSDPQNRFKTHRQKTEWWPRVDRVVLRWLPSRAEAFAAERQAIATELPEMNVARPKGAAR